MLIGIEQEFVFKDADGTYLDFQSGQYPVFQSIVDAFPLHPEDAGVFECKSLESAPKRLYVEGFERYDLHGRLVETTPKGLEIRTLPHSTLGGLVGEFIQSYRLMATAAAEFGLAPVLTSHHPFRSDVVWPRPLNQTERTLRDETRLAIATNAMLAHGMHVNVSLEDHGELQLEDLRQKLNGYLHFMVPFSFSSPFTNGTAFGGLSWRNHKRAEGRQLVQLEERKGLFLIQFRGYDACGDDALLRALLVLFRAVLLSPRLRDRAPRQNAEAIRRAAMLGFADPAIRAGAGEILAAARQVVADEKDALELLGGMLAMNDSYAARMKADHARDGDIMTAISDRYRLGSRV